VGRLPKGWGYKLKAVSLYPLHIRQLNYRPCRQLSTKQALMALFSYGGVLPTPILLGQNDQIKVQLQYCNQTDAGVESQRANFQQIYRQVLLIVNRYLLIW
jgi:hypothetical protein